MSTPKEVMVEDVACPLGCDKDDEVVLTGRDLLHDLPGEFTVVKCRNCGLMRTNPRPTPDTIGFYYPDEYGPYKITHDDVQVTQKRSLIRRWFSAVANNNPKEIPLRNPGRLLEIGCASGAFLHQMHQMGWEVEGIEYSEKAADAARSMGYPVYTGAVESSVDPMRPYDLIVGWMVLEHLHEPVAVLQRLRKRINDDGWMVISVPDAGALDLKIFKNNWYALHLPNHLFHYDTTTLRQMLGRSGWKIERIFWHNNPNNLLHSLRYCCVDHNWTSAAKYIEDVIECRRHRYVRLLLGILLGKLRQSGRMTIWARPN